MPKNSEIKFSRYFDLPIPSLRSYFGLVREGQPEEYRTTFARGCKVSAVLEEWSHTLNTLNDEVFKSLLNFENDMRAKVGPMSIMLPLDKRMTDIDHYYDDILLSSVPVSQSALKAVISEFTPLRGFFVRDQHRVVELMKKSTNSGSPYFTKRKDVVEKTMPTKSRIHNEKEVISELCKGFHNESTWPVTAILGWRGQEGGPKRSDVKQRVVWMFPFSVNITELQVYQPLIELAQKFNLIPAWVSMESVDDRITRMFDTKGEDDLVVCTDFSKFDQHFNRDMQDAARSILTQCLVSNSVSQDWLDNVFPIKYVIPLAYDWNKIRTGYHGMGSGSGGTNADETLAHRALQYEAALNAHQRLNPNSQCLGDDGVLTYPGITVEDVVRSYTAHGQEMNESKQYASKHDCVYLRRWHHDAYRVGKTCVGVYSTYRALGRLMEQERFYDPDVWSKEMVALRQLSIIENCKYHPLKEEFADFCMKRDKYRLGVDIPGFLDKVSTIAQKATDLMPDFLGYTKSMTKDQVGLDSWWIVNYLKSKR